MFANVAAVVPPAGATRMTLKDVQRKFGGLLGSAYVIYDPGQNHEPMVWTTGNSFLMPIVTGENDTVGPPPGNAGWVQLDAQAEIIGFLDNGGAEIKVVAPKRHIDTGQATAETTDYHNNQMRDYQEKTITNLGKRIDAATAEIKKKGSVAVPWTTTHSGWVNLTQIAGTRKNVRIDIESFHDRPQGLGQWQRIKLQEADGQIGGWLLWCGPVDGPLIEYSADILAATFSTVLDKKRYVLIYPAGEHPEQPAD